MTAAARPAARPADRPVARLTSPGEIVAVVPVLCGFVPQESLVAVSLRGPGKRIGLTMRFDLDWVDEDPVDAAREVAERLALDGAAQALLVVFSERAADRTHLVEGVSDACLPHDVEVQEALLVRDGRWWSYHCPDRRCCPAEGTPLDVELTPALRLVEAERVLEGRAVLGSRDELAASVAPPQLLAAQLARQHLDAATDEWLDRRATEGAGPLRAAGAALAAGLLDASLTGQSVSPRDAARLAVAVHDVLVRDRLATWGLDRHDALLSVLLQTARAVVAPEDAPVLALLGWVAYARGDGGLANVALARCLASEPDLSLALLLREMLDRQVPPAQVRRLLRATLDGLPS